MLYDINAIDHLKIQVFDHIEMKFEFYAVKNNLRLSYDAAVIASWHLQWW